MISLPKKLLAAIFAALLTVSLLGLLFTMPVNAFADDADSEVRISAAENTEYLDIDDEGMFKGLKNKSITDTLSALLNGKTFTISLPDSVTAIDSGVVVNNVQKSIVGEYSDRLTSFTAPASVKTVGASAFKECTALTSVAIPGATVIEENAFLNCTAMRAFTFGNSLKTIGANAFRNCSALETITIPKTVTAINANAFSGCSAVTTVNYYAKDVNAMTASPFAGIGKATVNIGTGTSSDDTITVIPNNLFRNTAIVKVNLTNLAVTLENGFGQNSFENCVNLKTVNISNSKINRIGGAAFNGCSALSEIDLGKITNLQEIGANAFNGCASILSVTIPSTVTAIDTGAFNGCTGILEIKNLSNLTITKGNSSLHGGIGQYAKNIYSSEEDGGTRFVTAGDFKFFYYTDETEVALLVGYTGSAPTVTLPDTVTLNENSYETYKISTGAFRDNADIIDVVFPENADKATVSAIGTDAFSGCTALKGLYIPKSVKEVGANAFSGCTALVSVVIEDTANGLSTISKSVFKGCTSLTSVTIPRSVKTIGISAFEGCTSLNHINFNEYGEKKSGLTRIESSAFKGCTSLEEINLPAGLTDLRSTVFSGCTSLSKVSLPNNLTAVQSGIFTNCASGLLLIAPDASAYNIYKDMTVEGGDYFYGAAKVTYAVELKLKSGTGTSAVTSSEYRYFKVSSTLPVQEGYKISVWYTDEAHNQLYTDADLNTALAVDGVSEIALYAYNLAKPTAVTAKTGLVYSDAGIAVTSCNELFNDWKNSYDPLYKAVITGYKNMAGLEADFDGEKFSDAGLYYVSILIKDSETYGQWSEGVNLTVKIDPKEIDTDILDFEWGVVNGTSIGDLEPNTVAETVAIYVYGGKPYLEKQYKDEEKKVEEDHDADYIFNVRKSWVTLNGKKYTLVLKGDKNFGGSSIYIKDVDYLDNAGTSWGVYRTTVAKVALDENYRLPANAENSLLKDQGITITYDSFTRTYNITKTWFIISSNGNKLLTAGGNSGYNVNGWTYNYKGGPQVPAPALLYGEGQESKLLSYRLTMYIDDEEVYDSGTFRHNTFNKFVNPAMPAARYVLAVSIEDFEEEDGTIRTGTGISISLNEDVPFTYEFTVQKAPLASLLKTNGGPLESFSEDGFIEKSDASVTVDFGTATFGNLKSKIYLLTLNAEDVHPLALREQGTLWMQEEFDVYYTGFTITFRRAEEGGNYATEKEHGNVPYEMGTYTVNYNIFAPSYEDTFNDSSINRKYTLYIQGAVPAPTVVIAFTGKSWVNQINFGSKFFDVTYLDDSNEKSRTIRQELLAKNFSGVDKKDDYISAGPHKVLLSFNENYTGYAKWSNELTVVEIKGISYAVYNFNIEKAENSSTQKPQILPWTWGSYDAEKNVPMWATQFPAEYDYILVADNGSIYYYNPQEGQKGFNEAGFGYYWLKPIAAGNDNVKEFNTAVLGNSDEWFRLFIGKAEVSWDPAAAPRIDGWKYGDDSMFRVIGGKLASRFEELQDSWTNYFCTYSDYVLMMGGSKNITKYASLADLQKIGADGFVPAGSYVYVYELTASASDNYNSWIYPVDFTVVRTDNYWDVTPVIQDREYGDKKNVSDIPYTPHFGESENVVFEYWYLDENGVSSPLGSSVKGAELEIGNYEYEVTLKSSANYNKLTFRGSFKVRKAANGWTQVPNMIGWSEGRYDPDKNLPSAQAAFGNVFFTVKDADGNVVIERVAVSNLNAQMLNALDVGTYTIIADVAETSNYDGLSAEAHFAVFEDSVSMLGIIVATAIFVAIAVGLAVAGIILLLRKNKKIEEEFRKTVNAELKRR